MHTCLPRSCRKDAAVASVCNQAIVERLRDGVETLTARRQADCDAVGTSYCGTSGKAEFPTRACLAAHRLEQIADEPHEHLHEGGHEQQALALRPLPFHTLESADVTGEGLELASAGPVHEDLLVARPLPADSPM
jgi:hypothetical protein